MFVLAFHSLPFGNSYECGTCSEQVCEMLFFFPSWQTPQASAHLFFLGCLFLPPVLTLDPHPQLFVAKGRCGDIFFGKYKE